MSVFAEEVDAVPRSWAQRAYPKLIYFRGELDTSSNFTGLNIITSESVITTPS